MNIFNSLGSNYDFGFVWRSLTSNNSSSHFSKLKSYLEDKYQGKAILVYKGREAIELALNLLDLPKNTLVAINGFTCYAVYKAIENAEYKPVYLDIKGSNLNFSAETFEDSLKENPQVKVVIIQNTLGYPSDIEAIRKICQKKEIFIIEDLAHSVGTIYKNNTEAGTVGDFTVLSFSQDKMIDIVSGGALIIRNQDYQNSKTFKDLSSKQEIIDRLYPLFTYIIRKTYGIGLGKIVHALLKESNLLSNPMGSQNNTKVHNLPNWYCNLAYTCFQDLQNNLNHRKEITGVYSKQIDPKVLLKSIVDNVSHSSNLRFPIFVDNRSSLIKYLKGYGIYVSDIWYDSPVAPKKYMSLTSYQNQCPEAEKVSERILNLPTHKNVSMKQAEEIAERLNQWLKSH